MIITRALNTVYYYLGYGSSETNSTAISLFAQSALKENYGNLSSHAYELSCAVNGRRFSLCFAPRDPQLIVSNLNVSILNFISCIKKEKEKVYNYQKELISQKSYSYDRQSANQGIHNLYTETLCNSEAQRNKSLSERRDCLKLVRACDDKAMILDQKISNYKRASAKGGDAFLELCTLNANFCDALSDISIAVTNFFLINKSSLERDLKQTNEIKIKQKEIAIRIYAEIQALGKRIQNIKRTLSTVERELESIEKEIFEAIKNIALLEQMILMLNLLKMKCEEIDVSLNYIEDSFKKNKAPVAEIAELVEQIKELLK